MQWALATMCREACLHVGDHLSLCKPVKFNGALPTLFTWKAANAVHVVLVRSGLNTLVYFSDDDLLYFAKSGFEFEGADALVGQFVVDNVGGAQIGRLLVFDVVCDGSPRERYEKLQALPCGPSIVKQWCGARDALNDEFLRSLPHAADGLLGLTVVPMVYSS